MATGRVIRSAPGQLYACVVFWASAVLADTTGEYRVVNITQGPVRGRFDPQEKVYAFYNIPYATAPTGRNRFKAPLDPPVWMTTFDAVDRGIICPQPATHLYIGQNIQENCLVANVFVPDDTDKRNISVLVYFHGGAYQYLFGNDGSFNTLVKTNKLIVVTFNYRLGAHGFLCLGTKGIPGNAGLKDQVALLRWVKTNIASFGGNPEDVTISGCSAGGGSVDIMTLSKITSGLFKRAIVSSGTVFGAAGLQVDPLVNAQIYAKMINFNNVDNLDALEEFYETAPFQQLYSRHNESNGSTATKLLFAPCVERDVGEERVLEEAPIDIIKQGKYNKVPLLYGFSNMEGLGYTLSFNSMKDKMNDKFSNFLPGELYFKSEEERNEVAKTVKEFYFGDKPVSEDNILAYIDYFTDVMFAYPILKSLKHRLESLNDTIYLYEYAFVDDNTPSIPHTNKTGANHCDQNIAVRDANTTDFTPEHIQMRTIMREYTMNFILTESPWTEGSELVRWPPANANRSPHLSLGQTVQLKGILLEHRAALWDGIFDKYYRAPKPPSSNSVSLMVSNFLLLSAILNIIK